MKKTTYIQLIFLLFLLPGTVHSQSISKKKADKFFNDLQYAKAIKQYSVINERSPGDLYIVRQLAYAHKETSNYQMALKYFRVYASSPQAFSNDWLNYARLLKIDENYTEAEVWYRRYLDETPGDIKVQSELNNLLNLNDHQSPIDFLVRRTNQNTRFTDMCPTILNDQVIFASSRDTFSVVGRRNNLTGQPFLNLYIAGFYKRNMFEVEKFSKELNTKNHDGPIAFSKDGKTVYITRNSSFKSKKKQKNLKIFIAIWNGKKWINEREFPYNSDEYSIGHPALSQDGNTLYFCSNMPGGFGKTDIYKSIKTDNGWSKPENLGRTINTSDDELFPTIDVAGNLYFSSNGHWGHGGLDIFVAHLQNNNTYQIHNLGNNLNSSFDDFHLVKNGSKNEGFFTSNRPGGAGNDDIYHFSLNGILIQFEVRDFDTKAIIPDAIIEIKDKENNSSRKVSNTEGKDILKLEQGKSYAYRCSIKNYFSKTDKFTINLSSSVITKFVFLKKRK